MIIGPPNQGALARRMDHVFTRLFGPSAPSEEIAVTDRIVARVEHLALPPEFEYALRDPALSGGIGIDRAPALRRPAHDLDREALGVVDQTAIAFETVVSGREDRRLTKPASAGGRHVGDV